MYTGCFKMDEVTYTTNVYLLYRNGLMKILFTFFFVSSRYILYIYFQDLGLLKLYLFYHFKCEIPTLVIMFANQH